MPAEPTASLLDDLCRLQRLHLDGDARLELGRRLDSVMRSFADLRGVSASVGASPAPPEPIRRRPDEALAPLSLEQALANASRSAGGCFLVPRVVEG